MSTAGLFSLVSRSNNWLSERQAAIAQNVANANTPGYKTVDVRPFSEILAVTGGELHRSHRGHMEANSSTRLSAEPQVVDGGISTHSGNSVSLEREMLKSAEVSGKYALGTSVYKSFHRMLISCAR